MEIEKCAISDILHDEYPVPEGWSWRITYETFYLVNDQTGEKRVYHLDSHSKCLVKLYSDLLFSDWNHQKVKGNLKQKEKDDDDDGERSS